MQVDKRVYLGSHFVNVSIPNGPQFETGLSISKVNLSLIKLHIILFCNINILCILNFETKFEKVLEFCDFDHILLLIYVTRGRWQLVSNRRWY